MSASVMQLRTPDGASAEIYLQGAHLSRWCPAGGEERLFLSQRSSFAPGDAIRGGIPVIFPQFADVGPLPKHGFARTALWTCLEHGDDHARFSLDASDATNKIWPQAFHCELSLRIGGPRLEVELSVRNDGEAAMRFTAALHSYLRVQDIAKVRLQGLQALRYRDKTRGNAEFVETSTELSIEGEVDRVYLDAPEALRLIEPDRELRIEQRGFRDAVVWNPGAIVGAALRDLEQDGYRRMLCVEAATVGHPIELAAGETWRGSQTLQA